MARNIDNVDELEKDVSAYDTYTSGLRNMLTGGIYNRFLRKYFGRGRYFPRPPKEIFKRALELPHYNICSDWTNLFHMNNPYKSAKRSF